MKAALYLRVSAPGQETENQLLALRREAETRGWDLAGVYQEEESAWKGATSGNWPGRWRMREGAGFRCSWSGPCTG